MLGEPPDQVLIERKLKHFYFSNQEFHYNFIQAPGKGTWLDNFMLPYLYQIYWHLVNPITTQDIVINE